MKCFLLGQLGKKFLSTSDPKRRRIFHSGISVLLLKSLYECPIFPCKLVLFFPKLLNGSFSVYAIGLLVSCLSVVIFTFCVSFKAEMLTSRSEEL